MIDLAGASTKALDDMYREAITYFTNLAEGHEKQGRAGFSQEIKWQVEVIEERLRRLQNTIKALT